MKIVSLIIWTTRLFGRNFGYFVHIISDGNATIFRWWCGISDTSFNHPLKNLIKFTLKTHYVMLLFLTWLYLLQSNE